MTPLFITGTDTGVGKTLVAAGLLRLAARHGFASVALKPVAAGCEHEPEGLRNADALMLQAAMSERLSYQQVNPVALREPIAPHLAAARAGRELAVAPLAEHCRQVLAGCDAFALIEGAGGWRVPLNPRETLADLARALDCAVLLVVGMRLGCINHALLTAEAVGADGLRLAGWVANHCDPQMAAAEEVFDALQERLEAPCLGRVRWFASPDPERVADDLAAGLVGRDLLEL